MTKKYLIVVPVLTVLFFSSPVALAIENSKPVDKPDKWGEQVLKWKEKFKFNADNNTSMEERDRIIKEKKEKVCSNTQERVNERWSKYYTRRMGRVENMGKGTKILENRIAFYKGKGLNVSNLESDLVALRSLIGGYKTEYMKFLDLLEEVKTLPCANYQGEFLPKLRAAKDQWSVVQQQSTAIRDYYKNSVKKHLADLRAQLPEDKNEDQ